MSEWQTAYSTLAEVAATLSGLLFVSISVKLNTSSDEERGWMLVIAKRSFLDFLLVLGGALLFLMPGTSPYLIGWVLLWLSLTRAVWHVKYWRMFSGSPLLRPKPGEYAAPVMATLLMAVAGITMLLNYSIAPKLIYGAAMALLFGACQNAWRLLTR